jgi:hypothetical protein
VRQMDDGAVEMIGEIRATRTAGFPAGTQHKMIDDQLALAAEQIGQGLLAVRRIEQIILLHLFPWQFAPFAGQRIAGAGERFFLGEVSLTRGDPFIV